MKKITDWFQRYVLRQLTTPRDIVAASRAEAPLGDRFFGAPADSLHFSAPARLTNAPFIRSTPHLKQWDRADWQGVDPRIAYFLARLQMRLQQMGIPTYVHTAYRTRSAQDAAYNSGASTLRGDRAAHRVGAAGDLVHSNFHWELSRQEWDFIGKVGKEVHRLIQQGLPADDRWGLVWGGDWSKPWDPAHWELQDWRTLPTIQDGDPIRLTPRNILDRMAP